MKYLSTNGDLVKDFSDHGSNIHDYVELANDPKSDFSKEKNTNLIFSFQFLNIIYSWSFFNVLSEQDASKFHALINDTV